MEQEREIGKRRDIRNQYASPYANAQYSFRSSDTREQDGACQSQDRWERKDLYNRTDNNPRNYDFPVSSTNSCPRCGHADKYAAQKPYDRGISYYGTNLANYSSSSNGNGLYVRREQVSSNHTSQMCERSKYDYPITNNSSSSPGYDHSINISNSYYRKEEEGSSYGSQWKNSSHYRSRDSDSSKSQKYDARNAAIHPKGEEAQDCATETPVTNRSRRSDSGTSRKYDGHYPDIHPKGEEDQDYAMETPVTNRSRHSDSGTSRKYDGHYPDIHPKGEEDQDYAMETPVTNRSRHSDSGTSRKYDGHYPDIHPKGEEDQDYAMETPVTNRSRHSDSGTSRKYDGHYPDIYPKGEEDKDYAMETLVKTRSRHSDSGTSRKNCGRYPDIHPKGEEDKDYAMETPVTNRSRHSDSGTSRKYDGHYPDIHPKGEEGKDYAMETPVTNRSRHSDSGTSRKYDGHYPDIHPKGEEDQDYAMETPVTNRSRHSDSGTSRKYDGHYPDIHPKGEEDQDYAMETPVTNRSRHSDSGTSRKYDGHYPDIHPKGEEDQDYAMETPVTNRSRHSDSGTSRKYDGHYPDIHPKGEEDQDYAMETPVTNRSRHSDSGTSRKYDGHYPDIHPKGEEDQDYAMETPVTNRSRHSDSGTSRKYDGHYPDIHPKGEEDQDYAMETPVTNRSRHSDSGTSRKYDGHYPDIHPKGEEDQDYAMETPVTNRSRHSDSGTSRKYDGHYPDIYPKGEEDKDYAMETLVKTRSRHSDSGTSRKNCGRYPDIHPKGEEDKDYAPETRVTNRSRHSDSGTTRKYDGLNTEVHLKEWDKDYAAELQLKNWDDRSGRNYDHIKSSLNPVLDNRGTHLWSKEQQNVKYDAKAKLEDDACPVISSTCIDSQDHDFEMEPDTTTSYRKEQEDSNYRSQWKNRNSDGGRPIQKRKNRRKMSRKCNVEGHSTDISLKRKGNKNNADECQLRKSKHSENIKCKNDDPKPNLVVGSTSLDTKEQQAINYDAKALREDASCSVRSSSGNDLQHHNFETKPDTTSFEKEENGSSYGSQWKDNDSGSPKTVSCIEPQDINWTVLETKVEKVRKRRRLRKRVRIYTTGGNFVYMSREEVLSLNILGHRENQRNISQKCDVEGHSTDISPKQNENKNNADEIRRKKSDHSDKHSDNIDSNNDDPKPNLVVGGTSLDTKEQQAINFDAKALREDAGCSVRSSSGNDLQHHNFETKPDTTSFEKEQDGSGYGSQWKNSDSGSPKTVSCIEPQDINWTVLETKVEKVRKRRRLRKRVRIYTTGGNFVYMSREEVLSLNILGHRENERNISQKCDVEGHSTDISPKQNENKNNADEITRKKSDHSDKHSDNIDSNNDDPKPNLVVGGTSLDTKEQQAINYDAKALREDAGCSVRSSSGNDLQHHNFETKPDTTSFEKEQDGSGYGSQWKNSDSGRPIQKRKNRRKMSRKCNVEGRSTDISLKRKGNKNNADECRLRKSKHSENIKCKNDDPKPNLVVGGTSLCTKEQQAINYDAKALREDAGCSVRSSSGNDLQHHNFETKPDTTSFEKEQDGSGYGSQWKNSDSGSPKTVSCIEPQDINWTVPEAQVEKVRKTRRIRKRVKIYTTGGNFVYMSREEVVSLNLLGKPR